MSAQDQTEIWVISGRMYDGIHNRSKCAGEGCVVHNPSDEHLKDLPLLFREDRGFFERICEHGVGHPAIDDVRFKAARGQDISVHGCCGCCVKIS